MRRVVIAAVCLGAVVACQGTTIQTPVRSFDRPSDLALFCVMTDTRENEKLNAPAPLELCSADNIANPANWRCPHPEVGETVGNSCTATISASLPDGTNIFAGTSETAFQPSLFGVVANSTRGELALVNIGVGAIVDLNPTVPGFQFLPVGALPEHVRATHDGCRALTANVDSCDLSLVDLSHMINVSFLPYRDAGTTDAGPSVTVGSDYPIYNQRVTLMAGGQPIHARPGWVEIAPESRDGVADSGTCTGGVYRAWVSLPACQAVVEVDLTGTVGNVVRALEVSQTGTREIDPKTLSCPIECTSIAGTPNGYPVDLGADAAPATDGGGPSSPPPRVPTTQAFPGSLAIDVEHGVSRMFIADHVSRRVTIVPLDAVTGAPSAARAIDLAEQPIGVDVVRVSPRSEAGKFLYAIARDASVRVIDLDREVECETNPDPNDATLSGVPPTTPLPSQFATGLVPGDDPQPQARHLGCFPLGDPATPARSPLTTGPGITLPIGALPRDVAFVHLDLSPPPPNLVTTPPSAGPRVWVGDFAWIIGSDGRSMAVNIYDGCPAPNIPQLQGGGSYTPVCDPFNVDPSRSTAFLHQPEQPQPTLYDRVSHRPRRGTDRFSPPLNCADNSTGAPRLASEGVPLNASFSTGNGANTQIALGFDLGAGGDDMGAADLSVPDGGAAPDGGAVPDGGGVNGFSIPTVLIQPLPGPEQNNCQNFKSFSFNPYDTKNDTWTLDWEGVIPTTKRLSGVVGKTDATRFLDSGGAWCTRGVQAGDKLELTGCTQDTDCDLDATCQKSATAPADVTTGLCLPNTANQPQSTIDAATKACAPLLVAKLRYRVTSAKQGTTLSFGAAGATQVTDALVLDEIYEPEHSFQTLDCSADPNVCTQVTIPLPHTDGSVEQLTTTCLPTHDEHGAPAQRCLRACDAMHGCGQDFQCLPSRMGDMRCMYAPLSASLFSQCLPELQPYRIRVGDAFLVTGQATGFLSDLEPSPVDRECGLPANATAPFVRLRQSRIPLDAQKLKSCAAPVSYTTPYAFLPAGFERNVCALADDGSHTVVHFENPWFAFSLDVPKIDHVDMMSGHRFLSTVDPPPSLQLSFQVVGGQGALTISLASDVLAQQPRVAVTGPDHQTVYVVDEGRQTSPTGLRGQVLRLISAAQSIDRTFQVR